MSADGARRGASGSERPGWRAVFLDESSDAPEATGPVRADREAAGSEDGLEDFIRSRLRQGREGDAFGADERVTVDLAHLRTAGQRRGLVVGPLVLSQQEEAQGRGGRYAVELDRPAPNGSRLIAVWEEALSRD